MFKTFVSSLVLASSLYLPALAFSQTAPVEEMGGVGEIAAVDPEFYWPGADYDPSIPSPRSVIGYGVGEAVTTHANLIKYFEALAAAQPSRVKIFDYGASWQGRRLIYAAIGSPDKIANLTAIQADAQRLADPRKLAPGEAEAIIARHPAVVWLTHSVHGDEISPGDASMEVAYHLLAARGDTRIADMMRNTLVIIVPIQNPDGRDRFIATSVGSRGVLPDADPIAAERDQPWPGGRVNHAGFDLNRDWFALTQPETRGQTAAFQKWFPVVMVDAHEMGTDQTFFFPPEADPINPNVTAEQRALKEVLGQNTGRWFDRLGLTYFNRESFDLFYPGYGDGWPVAQGTISMTYEQGSTRGLLAKRSNGNVLAYRDAVKNHFVALLSTIEVAARDRGRFVRSFYEFRRSAIAEGRSEAVKAYVIPAQTDQSSADKLAAILTRQGIEVGRALASFNACGRSYSAGSYVISAAQPTKRLIRNLLERDVAMDPKFVAEQERLHRAGLRDEIYDVTGWSLPLLYNVAIDPCSSDPAVSKASADPQIILPGQIANPEAKVAFIVASGSTAASRFMTRGLQAGLVIRAVEKPITIEGRVFPAGSYAVLRSENTPDLDANLREIARLSGATVTGFNSSWVTDGPSLGSSRSVLLRSPRIAIAWDQPIDRNSAGATRYVLERKFGVPVTPVRARRMASAALGGFDVIILPDGEGSFDAAFGKAGAANLRTFVRNGGVLITMGTATSWLSDPELDVLALRREQVTISEADAKARLPKPKPEAGETSIPGVNLADATAYANAINEPTRDPTELDGAILRGETLPDHWLTAGLAPVVHIMVYGSDIYRPLTRDQGDNVVRFSAPEKVAASGIVWEETRAQIAFKPVTVVQELGRGIIVGFTIDPTYRGQADGLDSLLMNAIYNSAARARPIR